MPSVAAPFYINVVNQIGEYMCEIRVVLEQDGVEELLMQNVTRLEVLESSVAITSLFEGSREIPNSVIRNIDFLAGKVFLQKRS